MIGEGQKPSFFMLIAILAIQLFAGALFAVLPLLFAAATLGFRSGMWLNFKDKTLVTWKQYLWKDRNNAEVPFSHFEKITIKDKTVRPSKGLTRYYVGVFLEASEPFPVHYSSTAIFPNSPLKEMDLFLYKKHEPARAMAQELSSKLDSPVVEHLSQLLSYTE